MLESQVAMIVSYALLGFKVFCFVDAITRPAEAYPAADKNTKQFWLLILGLGLLAHFVFFQPLSLLNLAGSIAALVYAVDVRPAVRELTRR